MDVLYASRALNTSGAGMKRSTFIKTGAVGAAGIAIFGIREGLRQKRMADFLHELAPACAKKGLILSEQKKRSLFGVAEDYNLPVPQALSLLAIRNGIEADASCKECFSKKPVTEEMIAETLCKNSRHLDEKVGIAWLKAEFDRHIQSTIDDPSMHACYSDAQRDLEVERLQRISAIFSYFKALPQGERVLLGKKLAA